MGAVGSGQGCIQSGTDLLAYLVTKPSRLEMLETHGHLKAYEAANPSTCGYLCDGLSGGQTMEAFGSGQCCIQSGTDLLVYLVAKPSRLGMLETHCP